MTRSLTELKTLFDRGQIQQVFSAFEKDLDHIKWTENQPESQIVDNVERAILYAKFCVKVGYIPQALSVLENALKSCQVLVKTNEKKGTLLKAKATYVTAKAYFVFNCYERSQHTYQQIPKILESQNTLAAKKRIAKAYMQMSVLKCMSSNHSQALALLDNKAL